MKRVLITGISGFAGSHLANHLLEKGDYQISGTYHSDQSLDKINQIKDEISLQKVDLQKKEETDSLISSTNPDMIYHLAANASAKESFDNPSQIFFNNVTSQINLLESLREKNLKNTRVLVVSSAEVYGLVSSENLPIDEGTPYQPTNTYAVSKLSQDMLGLQYYLSYNLPIVRVRAFNHIGPGQSANFVVSSFAKKIAEAEKNNETVIKVGNLKSKRDFTDVRDMVRAYVLALELGKEGEVYNIGSDKSYSIDDILQRLIRISGKDIKVEADETLFRPMDNPETVSDSKKIRDLTGWKPEIDIDTTLSDTLEYWRKEV